MIESSTRTSDLTRVAPVGWRTTHAATPTDHTHAAPTGWRTTHAATPNRPHPCRTDRLADHPRCHPEQTTPMPHRPAGGPPTLF